MCRRLWALRGRGVKLEGLEILTAGQAAASLASRRLPEPSDAQGREELPDHLLDFGAVAAVGEVRAARDDVKPCSGDRAGDPPRHLESRGAVLRARDDLPRTADPRAVGKPVGARVGLVQ